MICEAVHTRATQWRERRAADSWMPRLSERKSGRTSIFTIDSGCGHVEAACRADLGGEES